MRIVFIVNYENTGNEHDNKFTFQTRQINISSNMKIMITDTHEYWNKQKEKKENKDNNNDYTYFVKIFYSFTSWKMLILNLWIQNLIGKKEKFHPPTK